jgi:hypothetical protein
MLFQNCYIALWQIIQVFLFFENKIILFKTSTLVSILTGGILQNFRIMFQLIWRSNAKVIKETTKQKRLKEKKENGPNRPKQPAR